MKLICDRQELSEALTLAAQVVSTRTTRPGIFAAGDITGDGCAIFKGIGIGSGAADDVLSASNVVDGINTVGHAQCAIRMHRDI